MTTVPLRLTEELKAIATAQATRAGISLNHYIATVLAAHVGAQAEAERVFAARAARARPGTPRAILARAGKSRWRGMDVEVAKERLQALHAAQSLEGLGWLRSLGLHKLTGGRSGTWALTINGPWRLVFRFKDGDAHDVEIVDYH